MARYAPLALAALLAAPAAQAQDTNPYGLASLSGAFRVAAGDLNGDGLPDLVTSQDGAFDLKYYRNVGTAGAPLFAAPVSLGVLRGSSFPTDISPSVSVGDLDGDGRLDLLVTDVSDASILKFSHDYYFYANTTPAGSDPDALPTFAAPTTNPFGLTGLTSIEGGAVPTLADLNQDGLLDVVTGTSQIVGDMNTTPQLIISLNVGSAGSPAFGDPVVNGFGLTSVPDRAAPAVADFDGDGDPDLLVGGEDGNFRFYANTPQAPPPPPAAAGAQAVRAPTVPGFGAPVLNPGGLVDVGNNSTPAALNLDGGFGDVLAGNSNGNFQYFGNQTLPVELVAFSATAHGARVHLSWTTASETNNAGFTVEQRRSDAWTAVSGLIAGRGTTTERSDYAFAVDGLTAGRHAFRLRQVDTDGTTTFSDVVTVEIGVEGAEGRVTLLGQRAVRIETNAPQAVAVEVFDLLGRSVAAQRLTASGTTVAPLPTLAAGAYVVRVRGERFAGTTTLVVR